MGEKEINKLEIVQVKETDKWCKRTKKYSMALTSLKNEN